MEMKQLVVNGTVYKVTDPEAARINDEKVSDGAWSGRNIVDRLCPAFTERGAMVSCQPVAGYPLSVVSHIAPVQEGSGDPCPDAWEDANSLYEYAIDDKEVAFTLTGGTYKVTVQCDAELAGISVYIPDNEQSVSGVMEGNTFLFSIPDGFTGEVWIAANSEAEEYTASFALQRLVPGNIRPITGHNSLTLWHGGKNLLNIGLWNAQSAYIRKNADGTLTLNPDGASSSASFCSYNTLRKLCPDIKAGGTYVFSAETSITNSQNKRIYLAETKTNWPFGSAITVTEEMLDATIYLYVGVANSECVLSNIQIEAGTVATPYALYDPGKYYIADCGQTVYGGAFHWNTGELVIDSQYVTVDGSKQFIGDSSYDKANSTNRYITVNHGFYHYALGTPPGLCDALKKATTSNWGTDTEDVINTFLPNDYTQLHMNIANTVLGITAGDDNATRTQKFSAYCQANPMHFVLPLAEPVTVQLTAREITALAGVNTLRSDTGDTTVAGRADLSAVLEKLVSAVAAAQGEG